MGSSSDVNGSGFKGVRFSETITMPPKGRHSIATTNVPLLPPVPSASLLPKHGFQMTNPTPEVDITAYMEQCRLWNTQLRESHESERKAWDIERTALKARIGELEAMLLKKGDPKRRSSNDSFNPSLHSFRFDVPNGIHRTRISSESTNVEPPVWKVPETTAPVTRVFSHEDEAGHLPSISEDEALPSLCQEVSPTSGSQDVENVPVPIEQVDKTLDGITLKSAALTSSFDKEITSPQFASPSQSPSPLPKSAADGSLLLDVSTLLSPMDEKLKRHAGHTPMAYDGTLSSDAASTAPLTPKQEKPVAPAPTKRPPIRPTEQSDSYFSFDLSNVKQDDSGKENHDKEEPLHEPEEDPALKGPLMLDPNAKSAESSTFLSVLDAKLEVEAEHQSREQSKEDLPSEKPQSQEEEDDMPRLKMRHSVNFGSAWGGDMPGRI